jgi:hypothetical protein
MGSVEHGACNGDYDSQVFSNLFFFSPSLVVFVFLLIMFGLLLMVICDLLKTFQVYILWMAQH